MPGPLSRIIDLVSPYAAAGDAAVHTCGTEAGSYLRRIDSCITQLKAQGPSGPVTRVKKKKRTQALTLRPGMPMMYAWKGCECSAPSDCAGAVPASGRGGGGLRFLEFMVQG